MVAINSLLFAAITLVSSAQATDTLTIYHNNKFAVQACKGLIGKTAVLFNETTDKAGFCNVKNQQALGTMAECIELMPHKDSRKEFLKTCKKFNLTEEDYLAAWKNATEFGYVNVTADPDFKKKKLYYKPVLLKKKKVEAAWDAVATRWYNYNYAQWYGIALFSYWFAVMFVAGICNLTYFLFPGFVKSLKGGISNAFRKYITLPALFKKTHAHHKSIFGVFYAILPTRLESILVVAWFIMALIMNLTNYVHVKPNYIWPQKSNELGRKIADRTGQISMWLMPPLVLFAGRNNFMQWVSGWPYARFVYIHKWISRVVFMMSIAHGVGMTYNGKGIGKYYTRNAKPYVRWGYVALVAMSIMVFQGFSYFRRTNYEVFVGVHIILAVFAIAGTWIHTTEQGYQMWMYGAVAVWVFDRVVRIARLATFGLRSATVQLIANETVKVTVSRPGWWKPFPGCHAFIHFMRPTCFWQSHPFTIVDSVTESNTITFYIKVKGGMTHGLYQYLAQQPAQTAQIKVSIEGPYGNRMAIDRFENDVFIAGGNGIPGIYYEATDIAKRLGEKRNVKLYWVVRHYRSLEWFYQELLKLKDLPISTTVYVTQPNVGLADPITTDLTDDEEQQEHEQEKKSDTEESNDYVAQVKKNLSFIQFIETKPDFYQIVGEEIKQLTGPIAFASCAHGNMVDDVRKSVVDNLSNSNHRVELFEQMQNW